LASRASISCSAESFLVENGRRVIFVAGFDEIVRVTAFKRDEVTTDLICMEIHLANGENIELHEDLDGFEEWMRHIESLPGITPDWRCKVIQPPFATNETLLFERPGRRCR
jgi:hypothetical protein